MRIRLSQSAEHNSDHADVEPSFSMGGLDFIMAHQAAMFDKPAESPFDNPAFGQSRKAAPVFVPRHDLHAQCARFAMRCHPVGKILSTIALVVTQPSQPAKPR